MHSYCDSKLETGVLPAPGDGSSQIQALSALFASRRYSGTPMLTARDRGVQMKESGSEQQSLSAVRRL
ncbi:hypothetical protein NDU88_003109 [Pleurodeles waltl]|uniref:Uncharacterized protein n=1 Tax=Pleurodeles waltl TaxID=8319 RepID=A0AAV7W3T5_PLEWA|nr:hypothetical protein NDU88_003109 [Pleurodeles waltl]